MESRFTLKHLKHALELNITELSSLVGRSENCDLQVDSETLSREHARLNIRGSDIYLQDLHSTNGTFVNERQIHETTLITPGDVVRFGQESFCLQSTAEDATVVFDKRALNQSESAMLVEDEDEDGTVMLQSIALPQGWEKGGFNTPTSSDANPDADLLLALGKHARSKLTLRYGLLLSITQEAKAPVVKLLSSDEHAASWKVGRNPSSDVRLEDGRVSEHHAELSFDGGHWYLRDTQSRNGTLKGNLKINELEISKAEKISIGPYDILLEPFEK